MRIALFTYRGNKFCGGQGIYSAYLAKEWKLAGHDVHARARPGEAAQYVGFHAIIEHDDLGTALWSLRIAFRPAPVRALPAAGGRAAGRRLSDIVSRMQKTPGLRAGRATGKMSEAP